MRKLTLQDFVVKATAAHKGRYSYPEQVYLNSKSKLEIVCPEHGLFKQEPQSHIRGGGCPKCGAIKKGDARRSSWSVFIERANAKHGARYVYPTQEYKGAHEKVRITCPEHGEFQTTANSHIRGSGCPKCGVIKSAGSNRSSFQIFVEKASSVHNGRYAYPEQCYLNAKGELKILCPEHGEFQQIADNHLQGNGCPECGIIKRSEGHKIKFSDLVEIASRVHDGFYSYSETGYVNITGKLNITCPVHGEFQQIADCHIRGGGCPKCACSGTSKGELELAEWLKEHGVLGSHRVSLKGLSSAVARNGKVPNAYMELDMYVPDKSLAVEFNGLYWHSEDRVGKDYHLGKTEACKELGIELIQIFEDEWYAKPEIVKSIISTRLGVYENRYYARKTTVVEVDASTAGAFYDANHIQGKTHCSKHYGLTTNGELVAMASFGNRSHLFKNNEGIELVRFCTRLNTQVVGGLSKLLAIYKDVMVKTYCDLRLFNGKGYKAVGFKELHVSKPSYYYFKGMKRFSRFNFQKHKLEKVLDSFDAALSEAENMVNNGYSRTFDCGNLVMVLEPRK